MFISLIEMKTKRKIWLLPIVLMSVLTSFMHSCKKDDIITSNPTKGKTTAIFNPNKTYGSLTDQEGNVYKTITIGSQTWMAENLRTTMYRNGDIIPEVRDADAWNNLTTGAYCNYQNTKSIDTIATYGRLYNWYALNDDRNIAPIGWHVPTDDDWKILEMFLGMNQSDADDYHKRRGTDEGSKLKETGTTHWISPNSEATNETGFTALPSSGRSKVIGFDRDNVTCFWWCTTEQSLDWAWSRQLYFSESCILRGYMLKRDGNSVRCLMD
jgi:uncharacterized protein (TIGR02145 family)